MLPKTWFILGVSSKIAKRALEADLELEKKALAAAFDRLEEKEIIEKELPRLEQILAKSKRGERPDFPPDCPPRLTTTDELMVAFADAMREKYG